MTPVLNIYLSDISEIIKKSSIPFCKPPNKHKNAHKEFIIDGILMFLIIYYLTSSPKGNDRSPESNVPRSISPKTLCSLSPTPMMLHIKFDQDWPPRFRDIQVQKCEIFVTQGQVTPK